MRNTDEAARLARAHHHELRNAAATSGAVVGATLGVFGGPMGLVAGCAVGAAMGMLMGVVLERETHRADVHDRELDFEAGVTDHDLGAHDIAAQELTSLQVHDADERISSHLDLLGLDAELDGREPGRHP